MQNSFVAPFVRHVQTAGASGASMVISCLRRIVGSVRLMAARCVLMAVAVIGAKLGTGGQRATMLVVQGV